jgi:hypothetical protein
LPKYRAVLSSLLHLLYVKTIIKTDKKERKMKKNVLSALVALMLFPTVGAAQNISASDLHWGAELRYDYFNESETLFSSDVSLGIRFKKNNYLGLRAGLGKGDTNVDASGGDYDYDAAILLADYTHFFPVGRSRKNSIFVGAEVGPVLHHYTDDFLPEDRGDYSKNEISPFAGFKLGYDFAVGTPHIQLGLHLNIIGIGCSAGITF